MEQKVAKIKDGLYRELQKRKDWAVKGLTILDNPDVLKMPLVVRRAMALSYLWEKIPAEIKDYEKIVGLTSFGSVQLGTIIPEYATEEEKEIGKKLGFTEISTFGHHPPDYDAMLSNGLSGYRKQILAKLEQELDKPEGEKRQKTIDMYQAMLICLEGLKKFADRYAKLALDMALKETNPERRSELLHISETLKRVPENAPESFEEALQSHWIYFCALHSCGDRVPTGRIDQFLYPYYKKDIESGKLTREEAKVLLACWLAKFSDRVMLNYDDVKAAALDPDQYTAGLFSAGQVPVEEDMEQSCLDNGLGSMAWLYIPESEGWEGAKVNSNLINAILSGQDAAGNDVTNDLTYLVLETWSELELVVPTLSVRISGDDAPEELYDACSKILRCGSGEPALYNDKVIIKGLQKAGFPLEVARGYANDGCWETLIPGKTSFSVDNVNAILLFEFALFGGKSILRDRMEGIDTGDASKFTSFEQVYDAFMKQFKNTFGTLIDRCRSNYHNVVKIAPDPLLSMFMDDCIERGLDMNDGGARYELHPLSLCGLTNVIDSMAAIKKLVFEKQMITMQELLSALKNNFEGQEELRQKLIHWAPKFGNDDDYVDSIAVRLLDDCQAYVNERCAEEPTGVLFRLMIGTFDRIGDYGGVTGATPDGRKAREATGNNFSPMTGCDLNGPTAAIKSVCKPDLEPYYVGCPLDMLINSNEAAGEAGIKKLSNLIHSFMDLGGTILTITGVSNEMLIDAKVHPEKHQGLRVRMGGLSAYFVAMPPAFQDLIIERNKHGV